MMLNDLGVGARKRVRDPLPKHSGDSLYNHVLMDRATIANPTVRVYTNDPNAVFREKDTKPHVIEVVNAKVLAFKPKRGRYTVFVKKVMHPGTRGTHSWQYANIQFRLRHNFAVPAMLRATFEDKPYRRMYS